MSSTPGLAVVPLTGHRGQRDEHIKHRQTVGGAADAFGLGRHLFADTLEQGVFQVADSLLGSQHLFLVILQLIGDEAFGVGQGLAADVVGRHGPQVTLGDLDGITEDPVVADLEGGNAGARPFLGLQAGNEPLALAADGPQLIQFGVVAGGDDATFPQGEGGSLHDAPLHQAADVVQRVDGGGKGLQEPGLQRGKTRQQGRHAAQGIVQGPQVAPGGRGHADTAVEPLKVGDLPKLRPHLLPQVRGLQQFFHRGKPLPDRLQSHQGIAEPLFQAPGAHGGGGPVQAAQERAGLLSLGHGGGDLQVAAGGRVQGQVFCPLVDLDVADVGDGRLAVFPQVVQGRPGRRQAGRHGAKTQGLGRCGPELATESEVGIVPLKDPTRCAGDDPLRQEGPQVGREGVLFQAVGQQHLPRVDAGRLSGRSRCAPQLRHPEFAGGQVQPGTPPGAAGALGEGKEVVVLVRKRGSRSRSEAPA